LIGTLEAGKQADLAVVSLEHIGQQPVHDVEATLVFSSSGRDIVRTMVNGKALD
jgi:cytosine/adenosine deaminase-related metal-dependent hydrolase